MSTPPPGCPRAAPGLKGRRYCGSRLGSENEAACGTRHHGSRLRSENEAHQRPTGQETRPASENDTACGTRHHGNRLRSENEAHQRPTGQESRPASENDTASGTRTAEADLSRKTLRTARPTSPDLPTPSTRPPQVWTAGPHTASKQRELATRSPPSLKGENRSFQVPRNNRDSPLDAMSAARRHRVASLGCSSCRGPPGVTTDTKPASNRAAVTRQLIAQPTTRTTSDHPASAR